jgi:hypothetical protein
MPVLLVHAQKLLKLILSAGWKKINGGGAFILTATAVLAQLKKYIKSSDFRGLVVLHTLEHN